MTAHGMQVTPTSDWPFALMLDEIWLRVRRTMVHRLEGYGLWMQSIPFRASMDEQIRNGEDLKRAVLGSILGPVDYAIFHGEAVFGPSNQLFRTKVPQVLSFGYELGRGLYGLETDAPEESDCERIARLCALFNLGISVFDLIYDLNPELRDQFAELFNKHILDSENSSGAVGLLQLTAEGGLVASEVRILLKLIAAFFSEVNALLDIKEDSDMLRQQVFDLLQAAYHSEVESAQPAQHAELAEVARAKSTLPFSVIHCLTRIANDGEVTLFADQIAKLVQNIGTLFWLLDDLVDIVGDLQSGSVNTLLLKTSSTWQMSSDASVNYPVLAELLQGDVIDSVADEIVSCTVCANQILQEIACGRDDARRLQNTLLMYIRSWLI